METLAEGRRRVAAWLWRHRFLGAALVANVVLVAALGRALLERHETRLQKDRAERQFAAVRKLAHTMVFDVHQSLEGVPGAQAARQTIVEGTLAFLQRLAPDAVDPLLRVELAGGYRRIGDIQAGTPPGAGDAGAAMVSYDRALALLEPVLRTVAPPRAARAELALVAVRRGALLTALSRWSEAEAIGLRGLDTARGLVAAGPASPAELRQLGASYRFVAGLYQRAGRPKELEAVSAEAVQQLEKLVALRAGGDTDNVSDLAAIHAIRAVHLEQDVGTPEARHAALGEYYQSLAVMKAVVERHPTHRRLAGDYGRVNRDTGLLLVELGRPREALEYHRRALEMATALAAQDPGDVRLRVERAQAQAHLATVLHATGDAAGAATAAQQALAGFDALPGALRDELVVQADRAAAHLELGRALEAQAAARRTPGERRAELIAACVHHERARRLLEENLKRRPVTTAAAEQAAEVDAAVARCGKV